MFQNFTVQLREILCGNLLMVACSILYLIWWVITFRPGAGGVITYVILLAVTSGLLHRQVTSELLIITAWAVLELSLVSFLYGVGRFSMPVTLGSVILILVAATISMVCYLLYYSLAPYPGFIDGMIPLIAVAVVMMSINAALIFSKG